MNLLSKYSIALVSLATVIGQTQATIAQNVSARQESDVNAENVAKAKGITVRITTIPNLLNSGKDEQNIASGVLIKKDDKTYFIITNKHVVRRDDQQYRAIIDISDSDNSNPLNTIRREPIELVDKNVDLDVALLKFESSEKYTAARLGNSTKLDKNARIIVGGYPQDPSNPGDIFRVAPLKLTEIQNDSLIYRPIQKNCQLSDNNIFICNAEPGMSGGPILNDQGEVIGIHQGSPDENTDKNQGIPINAVLSLFTEIPKDTSVQQPKVIELPPIHENSLIAPPILANQTPTPTNQPFTKLFRPPVIGGF